MNNELMQKIKALSTKGWIFYSYNEGRILLHEEHGEHTFTNWIKLESFVNKWLKNNSI